MDWSTLDPLKLEDDEAEEANPYRRPGRQRAKPAGRTQIMSNIARQMPIFDDESVTNYCARVAAAHGMPNARPWLLHRF